MALGKLKPLQFNAETFQKVAQAASAQTGKNSTPRSEDSVNFPVFETPINKKVLIYVPHHVYTDADGEEHMSMDKGAFHQVIIGKSFHTYRCVSGIQAEGIYDGTCPLCESVPDCWDLYNLEYAEQAKQKGIDPNNDPDDLLKSVRQELTKKMSIKNAEVWYTFPIVVIECEEGKLKPKVDDEGKLIGTPMWYSIREATYKDKWGSPLETQDLTHPAGSWLVLDFTYQSKSGKFDKMNSARALKVAVKDMPKYADWAKYYDELTAEWTPQKASEMVIANHYLSLEDLGKVEEEAMKPTRKKLDMFKVVSVGATAGLPAGETMTPEALMSNFGATPAEQETQVGVAPQDTVAQSSGQIPPTVESAGVPPQVL